MYKKIDILNLVCIYCWVGMIKHRGFTIAELLIAMVIIGVIATLTIPAAMNNISKYRYRSALKKSLSVTNNALEKHYAQTNLTASDYSTSEQIVDEIFKQHTVVIDGTDEFTSDDCTGSVFTTSDGMVFCVQNFKSEASASQTGKCNYDNTVPCVENEGPNLWIDVNGAKKPNKNTESSFKPQDIYPAQIYSTKVLPYGKPAIELLYGNSSENASGSQNSQQSNQNNENTDNTNPSNNNEDVVNLEEDRDNDFDINPDDTPENIKNKYNPNKWANFAEFLYWLLRKFGITII